MGNPRCSPLALTPPAPCSLLLLTGGCESISEDDGTRPPGTEQPDAGQSGGPDSGSGFAVSGTLTAAAGKQVPASAKLLVVWSVSSSSPDSLYKFGEGTSSGATFGMLLSAPLPTEALNNAELGVGLLLLGPASASPADGRYEGDAADELFTSAVGAAGQYAIIYKEKEQVTTRDWAAQFPVGYSCGKGVAAPPSGGLDSFEPDGASWEKCHGV